MNWKKIVSALFLLVTIVVVPMMLGHDFVSTVKVVAAAFGIVFWVICFFFAIASLVGDLDD